VARDHDVIAVDAHSPKWRRRQPAFAETVRTGPRLWVNEGVLLLRAQLVEVEMGPDDHVQFKGRIARAYRARLAAPHIVTNTKPEGMRETLHVTGIDIQHRVVECEDCRIRTTAAALKKSADRMNPDFK
jgi:hypothetical protein